MVSRNISVIHSFTYDSENIMHDRAKYGKSQIRVWYLDFQPMNVKNYTHKISQT